MTVELIGPFSADYRVTVDGSEVPYLRAVPLNAQQTEWGLILDGRMSLDISAEHLQQFVHFIADALAIGAGYNSYYHACQHQGERHNPFGTLMMRLDTLDEPGQAEGG